MTKGKSLLGIPRDELKNIMNELGEPAYRAKQIVEQLYRHRVTDPRKMSNLPQGLREKLNAMFSPFPVTVEERITAGDQTEKLLLQLHDGNRIEMVMIPTAERMTFCLSTQAGCPVGCRFCASGAAGLARNLSTAEILAELFAGAEIHGDWPDNIVFMGIGEGLLNTNNLFSALEFITSHDYIGMAPRRITVSTSGIVPGIYKLAELGKEFTLALSLHAVNDKIRAAIIPDKLRYPIAEILKATDFYRNTAGRMVTFEYTLLAGVNDSTRDAEILAALANKHHAKINLIAYNPTSDEFKRPADTVIERFQRKVESICCNVTLRRERGGGKKAACGQLRLGKIQNDGNL